MVSVALMCAMAAALTSVARASEAVQAAASATVQAKASVLSYGPTLKVGVETSGLYHISYEDLQKAGLLQGPVASARVALYGNRAGMLPTLNQSSLLYDDLASLPIALYDGGDGTFGPGDYFLFYGESPVVWTYRAADGRQPAFIHRQHSYTDKTYYFVGVNHPEGAARVEKAATAASAVAAPTTSMAANPTASAAEPATTLTTFPDYLCHETDRYNIVLGGQTWYGEVFNSSGESLTVPLTLTDISPEALGTAAMRGNVHLRVSAAALTSSGEARMNVKTGTASGDISLSSTHSGTSRAKGAYTAAFQHTSADLPVRLTYQKSGAAMRGYLDYIEINYMRQLRLNKGELLFRHPLSIGQAVGFRIENAPAGTQVWDVTNPYAVTALETQTLGGNAIQITTKGDSTLHTFLAFDPALAASTKTPSVIGLVSPQNLHALPQKDYVVVTHPDFLAQAQAIARLHEQRNGYRTGVATTDEVYNEFGSGTPDPSAIRLFMKMFYDRSQTAETTAVGARPVASAESNAAAAESATADAPKYLLLLGDASYDVKNRLGHSNKIPTFEVPDADSDEAPATDDGFAYMDEGEGLQAGASADYFSYQGQMDIAVGRLPVKTVAEAQAVLQKIDDYSNPYYYRRPDWMQKQGNLGDWRQEITFVTDDDFESVYEYTLNFTQDVAAIAPNFNIEKIYADSYVKKSDAVNAAYPEAQAALRRRMNQGGFFVGYIGHSGWDAWGDEKYITLNDIHQWEPILSYPMMYASSCTFAYYDQADKTSGAEEAVLHPQGGAISMIASTRSASLGTIEYVQHDFLMAAIDKRNGRQPTIGDAFLISKNKNRQRSGTGIFILLGDPGLKTALPRYDVKTLAINNKIVGQDELDTLKAFSRLTIEGQIENMGQRIETFNGTIQIKIFDKATRLKTMGNAQSRGGFNQVVEYELQNRQIYRGSAEVKDGRFSFTFMVPKDIAYHYGQGKISYYAYSDSSGDAAGAFTDLVVGGFNTDITLGEQAPEVKLYINKPNFLYGGEVGTAPVLYAEISDLYGLNTTGIGIGHDMVLVIDEDYKNAKVVNDLFEYNTGSYKEGTLTYPLNLSPGEHSIELKVWNIFNISGTGRLDFGVEASEVFKVTDVGVVPNPSVQGREVAFYFTHNGVGNIDRYELQIYDVCGRKVAAFSGKENSSYGYSVGPLTLGSTDRLSKGVYVVRVVAYNREGARHVAHTKWVLK